MADSTLGDLFLTHAFNKREPDGIYANIIQRILDLGDRFLGAATFTTDFYRLSPRFPPHYMYRCSTDNTEYTCNLFGEIASSDLGTVISSVGNHRFDGQDGIFQAITDKSKVKNVLALQKPTHCSDLLSALFDNQLATLNEVRLADEQEEITAGHTPFVKEWIRPSLPDGDGDILMVHMPLTYDGSTNANHGGVIKRVIQKKVINVEDLSCDIPTSAALPPVPEATTPDIPDTSDIALGARYDPQLLEDYGGPCFLHARNRLMQHDSIDMDGNLIPPWRYYRELRPGTMVLITATLHCFRFNVNIPGKNERKYYQIHVNRLEVLAKSPLEVERRLPPTIPKGVIVPFATASAAPSTAMSNTSQPEASSVPRKRKQEKRDGEASTSTSGKRRQIRGTKNSDAMDD